ncbi:unnamed protein product [Chrysodeixis includens]|uniref:Uncharacterized protein n=1 Tax=Chrysodeixis includens TaxID=689277 RepID=A0A9P0BP94_CHRIL|nr:unnamed protein product [Chrysodeixis includens]
MAGKAVSFNTNCNLGDSQLESVAKWMSCNGEMWGVGPTAVFASAAALFLYNELVSTVFIAGDQAHVSLLEKTMISTMVLGMLALMIHLWVCSMRFFQYYLDTLIRDSPNMLLEMTTAGLLGSQNEIMPLGPLTRFLRQQQPQIHITVCWFLSLCYADYVRKHYCQRFNMPYLEQWQAELQERAVRGVNRTMERVNSFVDSVHRRLRGIGLDPETNNLAETETHTVRSAVARDHRSASAVLIAACRVLTASRVAQSRVLAGRRRSSVCVWSANQARPLLMQLRNYELMSRQQDALVAVHRTPASVVLPLKTQSLEDCPWRSIDKLPFDSFVQ